MDEQPLDEYNDALDHLGPGQEQGDDDQEQEQGLEAEAGAVETAVALGLTEPPGAKSNVLFDQHPEIWPDYEESVMEKLVIRGKYPPTKETDSGHTSAPFLTMYERTKVLSFRASQLAHGADPFIEVKPHLTNVYDIALAELEAKRIPIILKRPLPNGEFEYWRLSDLMLL